MSTLRTRTGERAAQPNTGSASAATAANVSTAAAAAASPVTTPATTTGFATESDVTASAAGAGTATKEARGTRLRRMFEREPEAGGRLASLDAVRGFTILIMIFVNDVAGVRGAPAWMKHIEPAGADGMTFVDVVFPAFLFIVGMSIPFALERRLERGSSRLNVWRHVALRTISLLIIGVLMVNTEHISADGPLHPGLWTVLMYAGVMLVWFSPPSGFFSDGRRSLTWQIGGAVLLMVLAVLYRGDGVGGWIQIRPYWWGILGIIGWSYLVAAGAYILFRRNTTALLGTMGLLFSVYVAAAGGSFEGGLWNWISAGSIASHGGLTVSGVVLGVMLLPGSTLRTHGERMRWTLLYGAGLAAAAILLHSAADVHRIFIINKIYATLPWCLWCAAITAWVWTLFYGVLDVVGHRRSTRILEHSGQNALLAYILAPIFYAACAYTAFILATTNFYAAMGGNFALGFTRAVVFSFLVVWLAATLRRRGYLLKL